MWFLSIQVVQKLCTKLSFFKKKSTLASIGRLDNEKICKIWEKKAIFFSALLHKRFMSKLPVLAGQIMCRGGNPIESTKNNVADVFLLFLM